MKRKITLEELLDQRRGVAARFVALESPILEDLSVVGVEVPSSGQSQHFVAYAPCSENVVAVLLKWLTQSCDATIQECLARLLCFAKEPLDGVGVELAKLFERTSSPLLRWAIADTISEIRP